MGYISKQFKYNYFNRELNDWRKLKKFSEDNIDLLLKETVGDLKLKYPLRKHQKIGVILGCTLNKFLLGYDMGLGKTYMSLVILAKKFKDKEINKCLFLVQNISNIYNIADEFDKFDLGLSYVALDGGSEKRRKLFDEDRQIYILNYQGLVAYINRYGYKDLLGKFDAFVFDEMHNLKNKKTKIYKYCKLLSNESTLRLGLTGTPFDKNPLDFWSQLNILDGGETLGNYNTFLNLFFNKSYNYMGYPEWKFDKRKTSVFIKILSNRFIYYGTEECNDLPKKVYNTIKFKLPDNVYKEYEKMYKEFKEKYKGSEDDLDKLSIDVNYIKLKQLSSGFVNLSEKIDDFKISKIVEFENPKLDLLVDHLKILPKGKKAIVFVNFIYSGEKVSNRLVKEKIDHVLIDGDTKDLRKAFYEYKTSKNKNVLIINAIRGGTGLNLQFANYCFFYETPITVRHRMQAEKRIHREGQTNTCYYYDFVALNTYDERDLYNLRNGIEYFNKLMKK